MLEYRASKNCFLHMADPSSIPDTIMGPKPCMVPKHKMKSIAQSIVSCPPKQKKIIIIPNSIYAFFIDLYIYQAVQ